LRRVAVAVWVTGSVELEPPPVDATATITTIAITTAAAEPPIQYQRRGPVTRDRISPVLDELFVGASPAGSTATGSVASRVVVMY
jgi:hypothetical protein